MRRFPQITLLAFALCAFCVRGQAQLNFTLSPVVQTSTAGQTVVFSAIFQNTGSNTLFLNGDAINQIGSWQGLTVDDFFFAHVPASLAPSGSANDTWSGTLFDVQTGSDAQPGDYVGTFTVLGGADASASTELATQAFGVSVVPEISLTTMSLTGIVLAVAALSWRRKSVREIKPSA